MAMRYVVLALAAVASIASATIAGSAPTLTPKQALLQGVAAPARAPAEQVVHRMIVKFRDGAPAATLQSAGTARIQKLQSTTGLGIAHVRDLAGGASLMALGAPMPLSQAKAVAAQLANDPDVEYAEPDIRMKKACGAERPALRRMAVESLRADVDLHRRLAERQRLEVGDGHGGREPAVRLGREQGWRQCRGPGRHRHRHRQPSRPERC